MTKHTDEPNGDGVSWLTRARRTLASLLVNAAIMIAVLLAVMTYQTRNMLPTTDEPAPALSAITLDGTMYSLDRVSDKPVLVYFFAPWCKVCKFSSDNLVRLRRWRDKENLEIVAVALSYASIDDVRDYAERHKLNVPVLLGSPQLGADWRVYGFPTYYVLDREQHIAWRDLGYSTQFGMWWRTLVAL